MSNERIIERLTVVLQDVFGDDAIAYSPTLSADDIPGWDSLSDVSLMINVERAFSTRFSGAEWESLTQLGDLVRLLELRA